MKRSGDIASLSLNEIFFLQVNEDDIISTFITIGSHGPDKK
jgi:hypothetical protein